ncbi:unnamed protein product [Caenorhabditis angaria]|uniref:Uncharacterized protein n=1 Tax=Caenorhabditis angaria TaxID=860376 RepID=A0A9P1NA08_9PELO|nr:unnamed protein product [Caenorhabditis angaria]
MKKSSTARIIYCSFLYAICYKEPEEHSLDIVLKPIWNQIFRPKIDSKSDEPQNIEYRFTKSTNLLVLFDDSRIQESFVVDHRLSTGKCYDFDKIHSESVQWFMLVYQLMSGNSILVLHHNLLIEYMFDYDWWIESSTALFSMQFATRNPKNIHSILF